MFNSIIVIKAKIVVCPILGPISRKLKKAISSFVADIEIMVKLVVEHSQLFVDVFSEKWNKDYI